MGGRQEIGVLVAAAVVGNLEDLDRELGGTATAQQIRLGDRLDVTGEEHADVSDHRPPDHTRVVLVRPLTRRSGTALGGRRPVGPQGVPADIAGAQGLTGSGDRHRDAGRGGEGRRRDPHRGNGVRPGHADRADLATGEHAGETADMVGMEVCQEQVRHARDPEAVEAAPDSGRLRARVDDDRGVRSGPQGEGITLADVAGHHLPVRRRPAEQRTTHAEDRPNELWHRREQHQHPGDPEADGSSPRPEQSRRHDDEPAGCEKHQGQHDRIDALRGSTRTGRAARTARAEIDRTTRQCSARPRHLGDPPGRDERQPRCHPRGRRPDRGENGEPDAEHGRRPDCGFRQQIGRHRDDADRGRESGDDRHRRDLRRDRNSEGDRDRDRCPPSDGHGESRSHQNEPAGREDGQREAG